MCILNFFSVIRKSNRFDKNYRNRQDFVEQFLYIKVQSGNNSWTFTKQCSLANDKYVRQKYRTVNILVICEIQYRLNPRDIPIIFILRIDYRWISPWNSWAKSHAVKALRVISADVLWGYRGFSLVRGGRTRGWLRREEVIDSLGLGRAREEEMRTEAWASWHEFIAVSVKVSPPPRPSFSFARFGTARGEIAES